METTRPTLDMVLEHPLAEDIMNLVVVEPRVGEVVPLWSIEKHGGRGGGRVARSRLAWSPGRGLLGQEQVTQGHLQGGQVFPDKFTNFHGATLRGVWLPSLPFMNVRGKISLDVQEYEWPDGRKEIGGADFDHWATIGSALNFGFR